MEHDAPEFLLEFCKMNPIKELAVFGNYYEVINKIISTVKDKGRIVVTKEHLNISDEEDNNELSESFIEKVAGYKVRIL